MLSWLWSLLAIFAAQKATDAMSMSRDGSTITIEPKESATATVILIHGLGDSADGWAGAALELFEELPYARFVLPTAPEQPVTLNGGFKMTSWYDIESLDDRSQEKAAGLEDSRAIIDGIVDAQIAKGIPANRIVVSGFSQGGAMSLVAGLQSKHTLAGVLALSGYLVAADRFKLSDAAKDVPTLQCHGTSDPTVQMSWAVQSRDVLQEQGISNLEWKQYSGMGHSTCPQEMKDVKEWLAARLPEQVAAGGGSAAGEL
eukprot:gene5156-26577_t